MKPQRYRLAIVTEPKFVIAIQEIPDGFYHNSNAFSGVEI
jgi:hypothetical protein